MIKILLISPLPPPVGGIASWSVNFLNYYSKNQTKWEVIHQNTALTNRKITNTNIWNRLIGGIKDTCEIITNFSKNLDIIQPDIIHLTSSASLALLRDILLLHFVKRRKIPVIIHFRFGRIPTLANSKNWEWRLLCKVIHRSNKVIVIDQNSFETLLHVGFTNIVNIPNPISQELEEEAQNRKDLPNIRKKGRIVFVGHVVPAKGIFELVEACTSINEVKELLIIGPYENVIKAELISVAKKRENGCWLRFLGTLGKDEVLHHLHISSILALPSYTEGFPNVIIEAMAMSCPVVATDVGAITEMLNTYNKNPCGICVKPKNVEELSSALSSLIRDPENAKRMGQNGIKRVLTNFTFTNVSQMYEKVWKDAFTLTTKA
jgi:glycosyltransferase involved in cell wall biosynthesis